MLLVKLSLPKDSHQGAAHTTRPRFVTQAVTMTWGQIWDEAKPERFRKGRRLGNQNSPRPGRTQAAVSRNASRRGREGSGDVSLLGWCLGCGGVEGTQGRACCPQIPPHWGLIIFHSLESRKLWFLFLWVLIVSAFNTLGVESTGVPEILNPSVLSGSHLVSSGH